MSDSAAAPAAASEKKVAASSDQKEQKENNSAPQQPEFKWLPLTRDYGIEHDALQVKRIHTSLHPLLSKEILARVNAATAAAAAAAASSSPTSPTSPSTATADAIAAAVAASPRRPPPTDPLSLLAAASKNAPKEEVFDPLRSMAASEKQNPTATSSLSSSTTTPASLTSALASSAPSLSTVDSVSYGAVQSDPISSSKYTADGYEPWRDKRAAVLTKYTTNKRMPVTASFLEEEAIVAPKVVDAAKSRLEELEADAVAAAAGEGKIAMTQKEYIVHIEEQHERLKNAWEGGDRVLSLKIAIQCAKLLGGSDVPQFYPSMYVLLTDILDTFGDLVFERIKRKGIDVINQQTKVKTAVSLPVNFKHTDVSTSAQETCRNWFYKTACIRELIPRLYIDMCLLKCYRFVDADDSYPQRFARLSRMIRGIGDPLCATYARAYLSTKCGDVWNSFSNDQAKAGAATTIPKIYQACLIESFDDTLFTYKALLAQENVNNIQCVKAEKIGKDEYIDLYSPALQWLLQNIGYKSSEDLFFALLQQYKDYCNSSSVLVHILSAFQSSFVSNHAMDMCQIIKASDEISTTPKSQCYLALGRSLIRSTPPQNQRLPILNDVWKVVTKITNPLEYIEIAVVFIQYLLINFTEREVNIFLKDVIKHMRTEEAEYKTNTRIQDYLLQIVNTIMKYSKDLNKILSMDHFLPILDLLEKQYKIDASKSVLIRFTQSGFKTSDPIIIHTLFDVARACHDSIDSLSFEDERKQISQLIINFLRQIDFGRDLEQQLNIYVECRAAFTSLDLVTQELVLRVALLCMKAHKFMKGTHSKKTAAFVKACLAYAHITIPSLEDIFSKLRLLLICGEVSLVNSMIVQSEGFLKAAISLIPDVPSSIEVYKTIVQTEEELVSFLKNFTSFLLLFPGHPEHGPFYLIKGLLNAVQTYEPWSAGSVGKARVFISVLTLFCTYYQRNFPYHIAKVESNDDLFGGDPTYMKQLMPFLDTLITEILGQLTKIGERGDLAAKKQQGTLALDLVNVLITSVTMNVTSATLVVKLVGLAVKTNAVDQSYINSTIRHIQSKKSTWYQDIGSKLVLTLQQQQQQQQPPPTPRGGAVTTA